MGATSATFAFFAVASSTTERTVKLLPHPGPPVSTATLLVSASWTASCWPGAERDGAAHRVHMAVSRLRKTLAPLDGSDGPRLRTVSGGYLLDVQPDELDAEVFAERARDGRRALEDGDPARASELLIEALGLWRGPPLAEVAFEEFAQAEIRRLEELRLVAVETQIDADLQLGRHAELIADIESLLAQDPSRERLAGQLMRALYRSGRQADALDVYQRIRTHLTEDLGLEPGPALKALQAEILEQAPALDRVAPASGKSRREPNPRAAAPPLPPTATIGRDEDLDSLRKMLFSDERRLVTLVGAGGVGKTRLALALARSVDAEFPDRVCWVELSGTAHVDGVATAIARALNLTPETGETAEDTLRRHLAARRILLVLDNFEHVLQASSVVASLLGACSGLVVVATSREPLNIAAEQRYPVEALELPVQPERATVAEVETAAGTAMFLDAARRRDARFTVTPSTAPKIARLCTRLDGLPLALELAGARVGLFGLSELTDWLQVTVADLGPAPRCSGPSEDAALHGRVELSPARRKRTALLCSLRPIRGRCEPGSRSSCHGRGGWDFSCADR